MGPGSQAIRAQGRRGSLWLVALALVAALLGAGVIAATHPATAEAGIKGKAKKKTKKKVMKRGGRPVKISCRKTKKKGVICKWTYAELLAAGSVRNCKGSSKLKRKRGKLRFRKRGCKSDRGAAAVIGLLPDKLLNEGLEATSVFCWTTLGNGYRCAWESLKFNLASIERCEGTALSRDRKVTISPQGCSADEELTAAQAGVRGALSNKGLNPGQIDCRPGSPIRCEWTASTSSAGWIYSCSGAATGSDPYGDFNTGNCKLSAPDEAPLKGQLGPHPAFGVNEGWPNFHGQLPALRNDFDAETARFTVSWQTVDRGPAEARDWFFPDATYNAMVAQGLQPTIILAGAPCWAVDTGEPCNPGEGDHPPSVDNMSAWSDFVEEAADRYPAALGFEIWNEANAGLFFHGAPRPARYAKVLETAYDAIKSVDKGMPVITTGLAPFASSGPGYQRYDDFLRDLYAQGIKGHYDAIGHHGYTGRAPYEDYEQSIRIQLADLKDVMLDYGEQDTDIWITETGLSNYGSKSFNESQQATGLVKLYRQYRRIPGVPVVIVHRWRDDGTAGGALGAERGYGLQRHNGTIKPVYCSLSDARNASSPASC